MNYLYLGLFLAKKNLESYIREKRVEDLIKGDFTKGSDFIITIPEAIQIRYFKVYIKAFEET